MDHHSFKLLQRLDWLPVPSAKRDGRQVTEPELERVVLTVAVAILNPSESWFSVDSPQAFKGHEWTMLLVTVPWDTNTLADQVKKITKITTKEEQRLREFFPPHFIGALQEPATIIDKFGSILAWYLPDILTQLRIVSVNVDAVQQLNASLPSERA